MEGAARAKEVREEYETGPRRWAVAGQRIVEEDPRGVEDGAADESRRKRRRRLGGRRSSRDRFLGEPSASGGEGDSRRGAPATEGGGRRASRGVRRRSGGRAILGGKRGGARRAAYGGAGRDRPRPRPAPTKANLDTKSCLSQGAEPAGMEGTRRVLVAPNRVRPRDLPGEARLVALLVTPSWERNVRSHSAGLARARRQWAAPHAANVMVMAIAKMLARGTRSPCSTRTRGRRPARVANENRWEERGGHFTEGTALEIDALLAAGVEQADAFVASTDGDNTNLVIAQIASALRRRTVVVRVLDPARATLVRRAGPQTVCPT